MLYKLDKNNDEIFTKFSKQNPSFHNWKEYICSRNDELFYCNSDTPILFYKTNNIYTTAGHFLKYNLNLIDDIIEQNNIKYIDVKNNYNEYFGYKPTVKTEITSDVLINLPNNYEDYFKTLGKTTRKNLRWCLNKLKNDYNLEINIIKNKDITIDILEELTLLKKDRFQKEKNTEYQINSEELYSRIMMNKSDLFCVNLYGKLEAAVEMISGTDNNDMYVSFCSYNIQYDKYSLGTISFLLTIEYAIANKYKVYHFMYEMTPLKQYLGGVLMECTNIRIYPRKNLSYYKDKIIKEMIYYNFKYLVKRNKKTRKIILKIKKNRYIMSFLQKSGLMKLLNV